MCSIPLVAGGRGGAIPLVSFCAHPRATVCRSGARQRLPGGIGGAALGYCVPAQSTLHACSRYRSFSLVCASVANADAPTVFTLPTLLTLGRVAAIPALITCWFAQDWPACAAIFLGASLTDFLDGYLARKMNSSTPFGAFLDPVADKLMVAAVLILMSTLPVPAGPLAGNPLVLPVLSCVIIGREITMSALREWAAALGGSAHRAVAVSWLGKMKTAVQMAALTVLLLVRVPALPPKAAEWAGVTGVPLLAAAAFLGALSLFQYFAALWKFMAPAKRRGGAEDSTMYRF